MKRFTPNYQPDGMTGGHAAERFDDGLVHNHHWAVTGDEKYPDHNRGLVTERRLRWVGISTSHTQGRATPEHDRHDDGLVHNHDWAVSGK